MGIKPLTRPHDRPYSGPSRGKERGLSHTGYVSTAQSQAGRYQKHPASWDTAMTDPHYKTHCLCNGSLTDLWGWTSSPV